MANVRKFDYVPVNSTRPHTDVEANIGGVEINGEKFIQIDTFGSSDRMIPGKTSQTLRLSKSAFDELADLGKNFF